VGWGLPEQAQRELIKLKLKPGCLIHLFCDFTSPPKNKFVVLVHVDYEEDLLLCFIVNSEISSFIRNNPVLSRSQVDLKQTDYKFFIQDSHLDCSSVIDDFKIDAVIDHLIQMPNDYKCVLTENDIFEIIQVVNSSETISDYDKNLIINSLGE
jgi:hypothetical protein